MKRIDSVLNLIGNTPLVELKKIVEPGMARIFVKLEYLNPSGSIKDRIAKHMIERAERDGRLKPGGTIVENTSGNTGLGLAMVSALKGYKTIFTMPDKMSMEKVDSLKAYGAKVIITPTDVAHDSPENYCQVAKRIARETPGAFYVDQYDQTDNTDAHYCSTGPEIWGDTGGDIDYLVAAAGTGGTVSGTGRYLKERAKKEGKDLKVLCPDPVGSIFYDLFLSQEPSEPQVYHVEGIGNDYKVGCLDFSVIDKMVKVPDKESFKIARRLMREEGFFCGGSSGTNVAAALRLAKELGGEKTIVTFLCDSGSRYISKFHSDSWMKEQGFSIS